MKRAASDETFSNLALEIKDASRQFYLGQMVSFSVFSIWHFLGEPCAKGALFSKEFDNCTYSMKQAQSMRKQFGVDSLVGILNRAEQLQKILIPDKKEIHAPSKTESDLKALHDPINSARVFHENRECSPKKLITDHLEKTPDYLNFHPHRVKNVLIDLQHLVPEDVILRLHGPSSMIGLDQLFESRECARADTFFRTVASPRLSVLGLKMHLLSLILSKQNRTAFGLSRLDVDPKV